MNALQNIEIRKDGSGYFILFHKPSEMPIESTGFIKKKSAKHALDLFERDIYNWGGKNVAEICAGRCILDQQGIMHHRNSVIYTARLVHGEIDTHTNVPYNER